MLLVYLICIEYLDNNKVLINDQRLSDVIIATDASLQEDDEARYIYTTLHSQLDAVSSYEKTPC